MFFPLDMLQFLKMVWFYIRVWREKDRGRVTHQVRLGEWHCSKEHISKPLMEESADEGQHKSAVRRRRTMDSLVSTSTAAASARKASFYSRSEDSNIRTWLHEAKKQTESSKAASNSGSVHSAHASFDKLLDIDPNKRFLHRLASQFNSAPATIMLPVWIVCFVAVYKITRAVAADPFARTVFDEKIHALSATKLVEVREPFPDGLRRGRYLALRPFLPRCVVALLCA
jgi:hypothetical protein